MTTSILRQITTALGAALIAVSLGVCQGCTEKATPVVHVESVSISSQTVELTVGDTFSLTATVLPSNADDRGISWKSDAPSVASVSQDGVVTAVAAGSATVSAVTNDGAKTASCRVTVKNPVIEVSSIVISQAALTLTEGDSYTLSAVVTPDNASDKSLSWSSSDNSIASVENGVVKALSAGSAVITVFSSNPNVSASCTVEVLPKTISVTGVTLDRESAALLVGEKLTLLASVLPSDATDKDVTWRSSDDKVAKVTSGEVTAVSEGECIITVTTRDGEFTAECKVTVGKTSGVIPEIGYGE